MAEADSNLSRNHYIFLSFACLRWFVLKRDQSIAINLVLFLRSKAMLTVLMYKGLKRKQQCIWKNKISMVRVGRRRCKKHASN